MPLDKDVEYLEQVSAVIEAERSISRRGFIKLAAGCIAGLAAWRVLGVQAAGPVIIIDRAQGLVIGDPTKCVSCNRCELACTEFNDGRASLAQARLKINRNLQFGPQGLNYGQRRFGDWGDGLVVMDTCRQCPHPVPCADACPQNAIVLLPETGARAIDPTKCNGCKMCLKACPWDMISFDPESEKATKCFLCGGRPKCTEACPAGALKYVAWTDLTRETPMRVHTLSLTPVFKPGICLECHEK
ncbi:MAG: 4Fe-4S binding protein [Deltaproteobacteria bacterium]|nr:4Fe-4S binding protein [Deltaproteobacteria bacterium]